MNQRLYLETTIPSYLISRPSRDVVIAGQSECRHCQRHRESLSAVRWGVPGNLHAGRIVLEELSMADDYIVGEVRRLRNEQAAKHGFDVKAILAAAKRRQRRSRRTVVSLLPKKTLGAARPHASA